MTTKAILGRARAGLFQLLTVILIALLLLPAPAAAGPWTVGPQTVSFSGSEILGDGSTPQGGPMPVFAYEKPDYDDGITDRSPYISTNNGGGQYVTVAEGAHEPKARFDCNATHRNMDDAIVAPGVVGGSAHEHEWSGNTLGNANSTYQSLRTSGFSVCYGGGLNRTAYWSSIMKEEKPGGFAVARHSRNVVTYYMNPQGITNYFKTHRWPRGIDLISGFNPSDPGNTRYWNAIAAGNAAGQNLQAEYTFVSMPLTDKHQSTGFVGWQCEVPLTGNGSNANSPNTGQPVQPWLKNPNGTLTLDCAPNTNIIKSIVSAPCYDGKNLTSPNGRDHMFPPVHDNSLGRGRCPNGWYWTVQFESKEYYFQTGPTDMKKLFLSSDRMNSPSTPADPTSPSPCRQVGPYFCNGETAHFDLIPAWEYGDASNPGAMFKMFNNCLSLTMTINGITTAPTEPRECNFGNIASNERLVGGPFSGTSNPTVNLNPDHTGLGKYYPITALDKGPFKVEGQHNH